MVSSEEIRAVRMAGAVRGDHLASYPHRWDIL